jgi:hypothetical protein
MTSEVMDRLLWHSEGALGPLWLPSDQGVRSMRCALTKRLDINSLLSHEDNRSRRP